MRTSIALALLLIAAMAAPLQAEEQRPDPVKKGKAAALIAETKTDGVWRTDDAGEITHLRSGLTCPVSDADDPMQLTNLHVYPNPDKGADVSCTFSIKGEAGQATLTLYVYLTGGATAEQLMGEATSAITSAHPDWKRAAGPKIAISISDPNGGNKVEPLSARYEQTGPPALYSSVWVGVVGNWAIKVRATYPKADSDSTELMSLVTWSAAHLEISDGPGAKPK